MNMLPIIAAALILTLSGCLGGGADASLSYDGNSSGSHSESVKCDDQGRIKGSGNVADGEVRIKLRDSDRTVLHEEVFNGEFTLTEKDISGTSGSWSLSAVRAGDDVVGDAFSGNYRFDVSC